MEACYTIITDENRVIKTYNGIPARTGYEFVRWNVDNHNGGYASYQRNAQVALSLFAPEGEDTYVTSAQPVWRKLVTIKYEKNTDDTVTGITTPSNNTLLEGATITLNKNARREGYTLLGWSKTPTGGETIKTISEPEFTELGESGRFEITLYAVWVKNYNITYDLQNGSDTVTVMGAGLKIGTTLYAIWLDGEGNVVPSPGTGESSFPMIIAFNAALLSLAAFAFIVAKEHRKTSKFQ